MTRNNQTIAQLDRGIEVDPFAKDQAISALVMRTLHVPQDAPNPAFPHCVAGTGDDSPSGFVRRLRAGRDMRGLI